MTVYNGVISNFIQGVSQQNRKQRFEGQVGKQENCLSSTLDGLKKRPGTHLLADLGSLGLFTGSAGYTYERGDGAERYYIRVLDGGVAVIDLNTGAPVAVTNPYQAYLLTANEETDIKFCTVGDTTFISNAATKVLGSGTSSAKPNKYLIFCKKASYGADYYVQCAPGILGSAPASTGAIASYTTDSTIVLDVTATTQEVDKTVGVSTHLVMNELWTQIYANLINPALGYGIIAQHYGDVIEITAPVGMALNLKVADTNHGNDLYCIHNEIDSYDKLPANAFNGYKVKVTGTDKTEFNDYYLQYVTESGQAYGIGAWKETMGWNITTGISAATMPVKLVRNSGGTFDLSACTWETRGAGDDDTNPMPSFVNSYISDVFTYSNRLCFTSKDNLIGSVTGEFYNFFANTVTAQSDSDPIDAASSDNQATDLKHGLIFNGNLVLVSNNAWFMHDSNTQFSTKNLSLAAKARFGNIVSVRPAVAGSSIFFVNSQGGAINIREMSMESLTNNVVAPKVTEQASNYIQGTAKQLAVDSMNNILFFRTSEANSLYVYQWYRVGNEVKQQAIHKWTFADPVLYVSVINGRLYLAQSHDSKVFMNYMDLSDEWTADMAFNLKLDSMIERTPTLYADGYYGFTLPTYYATGFAANELTVVVTSDDTRAGKQFLPNYVISGSLVMKIPEDMTGYPRFYIGRAYTSDVVLTTPTLKDQYNRIQDDSQLYLNSMHFDLRETGALSISTEYYSYEALVNQYNVANVMLASMIIANASTVLVSPAMLIDYKYKLPIRGKADSTLIRLTSTSHLPFKLVQASWSGQYNARGRRTQ